MIDPATLPPAATDPPPARAGVSRRSLAAVVLALIVLGVVGWLDLRHAHLTLREDAARRLAAVEKGTAQIRDRESRMAGELRESQAKLALLETRLAESQSQQAALESIYRELAPSRDDLALNEVEQILLIANQQLALARNVPAALAAMQLADAKLARIDRPPLGPLRRTLARDVDRLKALPFIDLTAITLKLDQAIVQVETLPLAKDERLPPPQRDQPPAGEPAWRKVLAEAWTELRTLVRLETSERPAAPLIAPDQAYFLRENLRLRLLSARIAILARQEASYKADLRAATGWLKHYFDTRTQPVRALIDAVEMMVAAPLPGDLPDLTASLDAVRTLKAALERDAVAPPVSGPER